MATRHFNFKPDLVDQVGLAADYISDAIDIGFYPGFAMQAVYTNSASIDAQIEIQGSNDGVIFEKIDDLITGISADGSALKNMPAQYYRFVRVKVYVEVGTMDLVVTCSSKGT